METNIANFSALHQNTDSDTRMRTFQAEKTKLAAVTSSRELDLDLMTQEGDRVTISLSARTASFNSSYETARKNENGLFYNKSELTVALYERELTFSVEGDLNDEEIRDIQKAMKTLDQMLNHFVRGQLIPIAADSKKLQDLESIKELEAQFSYQQVTLVAEHTALSTRSGGSPPETETEKDDVLSSLQKNNEAVLQLFQAADALAKNMAQRAGQSPVASDRMISLTARLFDDYRSRLTDSDPLGTEIMDRIAERFHNALTEDTIL